MKVKFQRGLPADKRNKAWSKPAVCAETGRPLCRWCGLPVTAKGRRTFCSSECVHEWSMRSNPRYVRGEVEKRDAGVCALCGLQCATRNERRWHWVGAVWTKRDLRGWEADHIVPLVEGGGYGLENLRTLCVPCHKLETKALAARRAASRASP